MKSRIPAVGVALVALAAAQPYRPFVVDGSSMTPTFASGQILIADVRPQSLQRGDVVVFRHGDETMVKRVAYLPGDSVERFWFVGAWRFPESGMARRALMRLKIPHRRDVVPSGHVYVLADNPWGSIDSRTLGPIPSGEVLAVVPGADAGAEWSLEGARRGRAALALI